MPGQDKPDRPEMAAAHHAPGVGWAQEVSESLLWHRLLRVPALAARPQRVMLSLFLFVVVGLLGQIRMPGRGDEPAYLDAVLGAKLSAMGDLGAALASLDAAGVSAAFARLLTQPTAIAIGDYPLECFLLGIPMLLVMSVLGGAVCRSVACEFSQEMTLPWTRQLGFAVARWRSLAGVLILPWAVVGVIALLLAAVGFVLFNGAPGLEIVGALVFGLGLVLGLVAVVTAVLATLAWPMLVPAVACEGTDAIDAAGRALAYVIARPVRLAVYLGVGGAVCAVAGTVAVLLAEGAAAFSSGAVTAWTSDRGFAEVYGAWPGGSPALGEDPGTEGAEPISGLAEASAAVVGFWSGLLRSLAAAYVLSMALTAGTLVYLFMRQICDGQHYAELWTPGQIERSLDAAMGGSVADTADPE